MARAAAGSSTRSPPSCARWAPTGRARLPVENQGFLRPDAYLAIVLVTNEDDCSATPGVPLFDTGSNTNIASQIGPPANFRCNEYGHMCNGMHPNRHAPGLDVNAMVSYDGCISNDTEHYLLGAVETANRIKALKSDPSKVIVAAITGPAQPYTVTWKAPSTADTSCGAASCPWPVIAHSCTAALDGSFADPAVRIIEFTNQFGANGIVRSICSDDLGAGSAKRRAGDRRPSAAVTIAGGRRLLDNPRSGGLVSNRRMMSRTGRGSLVVASLLASLWLAGRAEAGRAEEARDYLDRATGAFALNHFVEAADNYEKAFALKPDPAVLYNAAQAHRLAGNKQRALDLYQSYLRMYGTDKRAEIEKHIENLKQAIEKDRAVATSPPTTTAPVGSSSPPTAAPVGSTMVVLPASPPASSPPPAPAGGQPAPVLVTQASPPQQAQQADDGSLVSKPWFWAVVGGAVVAAVIAGVLLTRGDPSDPMATIGPPLDGN